MPPQHPLEREAALASTRADARFSVWHNAYSRPMRSWAASAAIAEATSVALPRPHAGRASTYPVAAR